MSSRNKEENGEASGQSALDIVNVGWEDFVDKSEKKTILDTVSTFVSIFSYTPVCEVCEYHLADCTCISPKV